MRLPVLWLVRGLWLLQAYWGGFNRGRIQAVGKWVGLDVSKLGVAGGCVDARGLRMEGTGFFTGNREKGGDPATPGTNAAHRRHGNDGSHFANGLGTATQAAGPAL